MTKQKSSKIFRIIVEILLIIMIIIVFYHFVYPRIFIKSIRSQLMVDYNTPNVVVSDPIECAKCTSEMDGVCANTKIKYNCFTYEVNVNGAKDYVEYDNFKLDHTLLDISIQLFETTNKAAKNIEYDNITYHNEYRKNEINITVNKNLSDILDYKYFQKLDTMNGILYEKYPTAQIPGNYLNFYIHYKDGYTINLNQLKSGLSGNGTNYMIFSCEGNSNELYYESPITEDRVDLAIVKIKNLKK